jgi:hypothetical protein
MMRTKMGLIGALCCGVMAGSAFAQPPSLADNVMDGVTAGLSGYSAYNFYPGVPSTPAQTAVADAPTPGSRAPGFESLFQTTSPLPTPGTICCTSSSHSSSTSQ